MNGVPPHFHKSGSPEGQISQQDLLPDGLIYSALPNSAPEGTEITYKSGSLIRRYRMIDGAWRYSVLYNLISASATYNPASLADGAGTTTTVTVTGAALGDLVLVSFSLDLQGITLTAYVSAADTVSVRFQNESGGTIDLGSGTLQVRVIPQAQFL